MSNANTFELISATMPIRALRPLWNVLTELQHSDVRDQLFEKFNLTKARLMSDERIPVAAIMQIFNHCERHKITESGFLTGVSGEYGQFGLFDYYLASIPTIGEMLLNFEKYFSILTTDKSLLTLTKPKNGLIQLSLPKSISNEDGDKLFNEMLLGIVLRTIKVNSGKANLLPEVIAFPYKNLPKSIVVFLTSKKIKVLLDKNNYELYYPSNVLDTALQYRDKLMVDILKPTLDKLLLKNQREQSITSQVIEIFNNSTDFSRLSLISVAEDLALSQSSLKRKLADEDSSFSFLLARFKQSHAMSLVTTSDTKLSDIALMLGYADRTAFERAFKEWFGITPSQIRQQAIITNLPKNTANPIKVDNFPAAPDIYIELMAMLDSEDHTINDIAKLIEDDPVLTGKLLGIAGSAYYGYREVVNVTGAITELFGLTQTRNFVLSIMSNNQFDTSKCKFLDLQLYWTHATATYEMIKIISKSMNFKSKAESERYCLAALLHRMFELVYASERPDDMRKYLMAIKDNDLIFDANASQEIEEQVFGMKGYQTTALLLAHWGLPADIHKNIREMSLPIEQQSLNAKVLNYVSDCFRYTIYSDANEEQKDVVLNQLSNLLSLDYDDIQQKIMGIENCLSEIEEQAKSMY